MDHFYLDPDVRALADFSGWVATNSRSRCRACGPGDAAANRRRTR